MQIELLEDAPEYEYKGGLFYAHCPNGKSRALRPHAFLKAFQRMAKTIQDYHATTGAEVVDFPRSVLHG